MPTKGRIMRELFGTDFGLDSKHSAQSQSQYGCQQYASPSQSYYSQQPPSQNSNYYSSPPQFYPQNNNPPPNNYCNQPPHQFGNGPSPNPYSRSQQPYSQGPPSDNPPPYSPQSHPPPGRGFFSQPPLPQHRQGQSPYPLVISTSPTDGSLHYIHHLHANPGSPPLFSLYNAPSVKPNLSLFVGEPVPGTSLAGATFTPKGTTSEIFYKGQTSNGKKSSFTDDVSFNSPMYGQWKWSAIKTSSLDSGDGKKGWELKDQGKRKLAVLKKIPPKDKPQRDWLTGEKKKSNERVRYSLEIENPVDGDMLEMICLTTIIMKIQNLAAKEAMNDAGTEIATEVIMGALGN